MLNSLLLTLTSFMLYFVTTNAVFTWIALFILFNEINAAVRWNLYIRKERNATDDI